MAFNYYDVEGIESGLCSTAFAEVLRLVAYKTFIIGFVTQSIPPIVTRISQALNWNLGGGATTAGTSGTGGTTIVVGGSYTWIG